jgi:hypothetical protein
MKNIVKLVAVLITVFTFPSCIRFVPQGQPIAIRPYVQNPQGFQEGLRQTQAQQRKLASVTVTKRQTGYCQARIWQGPENTPQNVQRVSNYASSVYEKTGHVPSEQTLTSKFGFRAQARWIDTPDKVVGKITVRPDEVPASIRARFQ